jgi:hypothetical protein
LRQQKFNRDGKRYAALTGFIFFAFAHKPFRLFSLFNAANVCLFSHTCAQIRQCPPSGDAVLADASGAGATGATN